MEKHPLQYFIDLIEGSKIADLRYGFLHVNPNLAVIGINEQDEYIVHYVEDVHYPGMMIEDQSYFKHFLNKLLPQKKAESLGEIDLYLLNTVDEKRKKDFINYITITITDLILRAKDCPDVLKYPVIASILNELRDTLERRYPATELNPTSNSIAVNNIITKLKWNAGVASLCTLFYELANDYKMEKKGISFIAASPDQLKKFMLTNFVDEEGNPFSEISVATYLDSRTDKKAKRNKVNIPTILPEAIKTPKK